MASTTRPFDAPPPGGGSPFGPIIQDGDPGAVGAGRLWITTTGTAKVRNAANSGWISLGGGGAGILATHYYDGGEKPLTAPVALTAFDATNAAISFVVPSSGKVIVRSNCSILATNGAGNGVLGYLIGSTQAGGGRYFVTPTNVYVPFEYAAEIDGLTPGATVIAKLAGTTDAGNLRLGSIAGNGLLMVAEAVPS